MNQKRSRQGGHLHLLKNNNNLSNKDRRFLQIAMGVATQSKCRMKHGALVVRHGKIVGASPNLWKNSPLNVDWRFSSVHAEIAAIRKVKVIKKCDIIYVARVNKSGKNRLSLPCDSCIEVIQELGCKVIWTTGVEIDSETGYSIRSYL